MKVIKGTRLYITHCRVGKFFGKAGADFEVNPNVDSFYPIIVDQDKPVLGISAVWERGDSVPCRSGHCDIAVV